MKVALFDRDGTVIVDPPDKRVTSIEKIDLFPDAIQALSYLADNNFALAFISNQPCINDGYITEAEFWRINDEFLRQLEPCGVKVLKTYMNADSAGVINEWRKPGPKMLQQAAEDFGFDIKDVFMTGDRPTDVQAGINAGCKGGVFIKREKLEAPNAIYTTSSLLDAVHYIVANS